ncbi:sugar phosphate isomerase/epimerase [Paenibacillus filicis]|uniref:Sugar phosphate isomerase/epimerase n=1 Tax=Paenibacillus filicis TaxID=669464 RepID=A0ABU9DJK4_9BACL
MELGIFAKTFARRSVEQVFEAVHNHGLSCAQFNLSCAGLPSMPDRIDENTARMIGREARARGIRLSAVSGTFNMAHPDEAHRCRGLRRLAVLAAICGEMGTSVITLCTGTRDPEHMWRRHADNCSAAAWMAMADTVGQALQIAEAHKVTLAIEPEGANIISTAAKARKLLLEMGSPYLKIVMDAANLYDPRQTKPMNDVLSEAFHLLGEHIVIAHAKDVSLAGDSPFVAAGQGLIDYAHYVQLLRAHGFDGALILHGLSEEQVGDSVQFLRSQLQA